jgi:hypothetical protein
MVCTIVDVGEIPADKYRNRTDVSGKVIISDSVTSIGPYAFAGCSKITRVEMSPSVMSIGERAFWGCSGLTSVTLSDSITSVEMGTFQNCYKLPSITIPSSVTSFKEVAFSQCHALTSMTIPSSVKLIENWVFWHCHMLKDIIISDSVTPLPLDWSSLVTHIPSMDRIHAPDHIIAHLGGTFAPFETMESVPAQHRITPSHVRTWVAAELYLWWSTPQLGGGTDAAYNANLSSHSRRIMIWTVMLSGFRTAETTEVLPYIPSEIWNLVFGFVKHTDIPD